MSFGFSISDIVGLSTAVFKLYNEFREAPGVCRAFAEELLHFHHILSSLGTHLQGNDVNCQYLAQDALQSCITSCEELVYVQILGAMDVPNGIRAIDALEKRKMIFYHSTDGFKYLPWRSKWAERKFSVQVPKLQRTIAAHIQSLTAFNTLIIRCVSLIS